MSRDKCLYSMLMEKPEQGLEKLMDDYMGYVYTIVHGQLSGTHRKQDIEECVSDVFFKIYENREKINLERGSLKAYIAVVAKRTAIDLFRKLDNPNNLVYLDSYDYDWLASDNNIADEASKKEKNETLIEAVKSLGEPDSQIIIRKYYLRQNSKTIGKVLGLKENTVNKRSSRALSKLKEKLEI